MKTVKWSVLKMPIDVKQRYRQKAEAAGISIAEALELHEKQISRAEFIQLSKIRKGNLNGR
jgi:hypothetical protein